MNPIGGKTKSAVSYLVGTKMMRSAILLLSVCIVGAVAAMGGSGSSSEETIRYKDQIERYLGGSGDGMSCCAMFVRSLLRR